MKFQDICDFLDLLRLRLDREVWLGFYGGEPLLSWPLIKKAVGYAEKSFKNRFRFTLTTNGSLVRKEHVLFFRRHRFELALSYDGLAQKYRDPRSLAVVEAALRNLQAGYPDGYTVNSVFTPRTVHLLAASIKKLLRQGHSNLQYSLDMCVPWENAERVVLEKQLDQLMIFCTEYRQKNGKMPLENFRGNGKRGIFACFAGRDRLALLPDRTVWGCYLFYDLLGHDPAHPDYARYCFGSLEEFLSAPAKTLARQAANYAELRQDLFFSDQKVLCSLCDELERCAVCPAVAALATRTLAVIPSWTCRIKKIERAAAAFAGQPAARI